MGFTIDGSYRSSVETFERQRRITPPEPRVQENTNYNPNINERSFAGANIRHDLERQLAENASPTRALEAINELPKPNPSDRAAVTEYKTQRAEIADYAINNSTPPKREDFSGLRPQSCRYGISRFAIVLQSTNQRTGNNFRRSRSKSEHDHFARRSG